MSIEFLGVLAALEPFLRTERQIMAEAVAVFLVVAVEEGRPMNVIASRLNSEPMRMTRRVRELSKGRWQRKQGQGLVYVALDEVDSRVRRVYLTERGREVAAEIKKALGLPTGK
jgi:DNA-binding MarR family transcriptional regulator